MVREEWILSLWLSPERILAKLGIEQVTSFSQVCNATDWAMGFSVWQLCKKQLLKTLNEKEKMLAPGFSAYPTIFSTLLTLHHTIPTFDNPERNDLKTLWEKKKMLVTSIFFFSHNVLYPVKYRNFHFISIYHLQMLWIWSSLQNCHFGRVSPFLICQFYALQIQQQIKIGYQKYEKMGKQLSDWVKMLWKKKLIVKSNFSFSHNVFKICMLLMHQNEYLWSKGL